MGQDVDFMIHGYLKVNFFGSDVYITTTHVCLCIVCLTLIAVGLVVNYKMKHAEVVPAGIQNIAEMYVELVDGMVKGNMFRHWKKYANYIAAIFLFILLANISGILGLRPPTADFGVTLTLALITFFMIQYNGFRSYGALGYLKNLTQPIPVLYP